MDVQSLEQLCSLCFTYKLQCSSDVELMKKIEKYLQIKMEYSWTGVCSSCHNSIQEFHEFYERVHSVQRNLRDTCHFVQGVANAQANAPANETESLVEASEPLNEYSTSDKETPGLAGCATQTEGGCKDTENDAFTDSSVKGSRGKLKASSESTTKISSETENKMLEFYNIKCEKCERRQFTSFKMLNKHYRTVHNMQGYIKCCKRNIRVNDKYYLRSHMYKHLQPDSCRCRVCGKELSSLATLKHHMILHKPSEERPFQCSECDKRFCCKNDLKNHKKTLHVPESERQDYICDVCGKIFQKVANLKYHYTSVHLQERRFICEICAKSFMTQSSLRTHITATHTALDPIQCQECHKWLKTKDTFQRHLQLHKNHAYPCPHCDKVCNSSASLRSHLVKHSEDRPHPCSLCSKTFKTKTHLKNHSLQHSEGNQYKCPFCTKQFVNMSNYYKHRRRMHLNASKAEDNPGTKNVDEDDGTETFVNST